MIPAVFDFMPEFIDFDKFLKEDAAWQLVSNEVFSVDHMSDKELREAIVEDVLTATMWEKQTGKRIDFTMNTLCRFLSHEQRVRIKEAMIHPEIYSLFDPNFNDNIRIFDTQVILQAAMDYVGVWFTGYVMPEGALCVDRQALQEAMDTHGGIDNFIDAIVMDLTSSHIATKTLN